MSDENWINNPSTDGPKATGDQKEQYVEESEERLKKLSKNVDRYLQVATMQNSNKNRKIQPREELKAFAYGLYAMNYSKKEIADIIGVHKNTVVNWLTNIKETDNAELQYLGEKVKETMASRCLVEASKVLASSKPEDLDNSKYIEKIKSLETLVKISRLMEDQSTDNIAVAVRAKSQTTDEYDRTMAELEELKRNIRKKKLGEDDGSD